MAAPGEVSAASATAVTSLSLVREYLYRRGLRGALAALDGEVAGRGLPAERTTTAEIARRLRVVALYRGADISEAVPSVLEVITRHLLVRRSGGDMKWTGKVVHLELPLQAIALGINAVHQEVVLCKHLSVAENICLGDEKVRLGLLQKRRMKALAQAILDDLGFTISAGATLTGSISSPAD